MKVLVITAKDKICPMEETECNPDYCPYAKGHFDRINDAMYELLQSENMFSRDIILECAGKHQVCPFEMSLDMSMYADAIICDYNYVFDPNVYLKRFFAEGLLLRPHFQSRPLHGRESLRRHCYGIDQSLCHHG